MTNSFDDSASAASSSPAIWLTALSCAPTICADFSESLSCAWARVTKAKDCESTSGKGAESSVFSIPGRVLAGYSRNEKIVPNVLLSGARISTPRRPQITRSV